MRDWGPQAQAGLDWGIRAHSAFIRGFKALFPSWLSQADNRVLIILNAMLVETRSVPLPHTWVHQ